MALVLKPLINHQWFRLTPWLAIDPCPHHDEQGALGMHYGDDIGRSQWDFARNKTLRENSLNVSMWDQVPANKKLAIF